MSPTSSELQDSGERSTVLLETSEGSPEGDERPRKRTRIRQACDRCRSRKIKCNQERPCGNCVAAKASCIDWRPGETTYRAPSSARPASPESIDQQTFTSHGRPGDASTALHYDAQESFSLEDDPFSNLPAAALPAASGILEPLHRADEWPSRPLADRFLRLAFPYDTLYRNERGFLKALSVSSGLAGLHYLQEHYRILQSMLDPVGRLIHELEMPAEALMPSLWDSLHTGAEATGTADPTPGEDVWLLLEQKIGAGIVSSLNLLIERELSMEVWTMVDHFLESIYVLWPTFILRSFTAQCSDVDARSRPEFVCLLLSIVALTARETGVQKVAEAGDGVDEAAVNLYWHIRHTNRRADWASPPAIQALLYLSMYSYGGFGAGGVSAGHTLINEAVSRCIDAGLHRCVDTYTDTFSREEVEARTRTLWAVFCADKISAAYGRPVMLPLSCIGVEEITVDDHTMSERRDSQECSFLPWHRATIRIYMSLEQIIQAINIPNCTASETINSTGHDPRRVKETVMHPSECSANHRGLDLHSYLEQMASRQSAGLPRATDAMKDDNMFDCHVERLRTTADFAKILVYRHLLTVGSSDLTGHPSTQAYSNDLLDACKDLLASQKKMLRRGLFTDFASTCSYMISQTGRALIPLLYLHQPLTAESNAGPPRSDASTDMIRSSLHLTMSLLSDLSPRLDASTRSRDILQVVLDRLDLQASSKQSTVLALGGAQLDPGTSGSNKTPQATSWIRDLPLNNPFGDRALQDLQFAMPTWQSMHFMP